MSLTAKDILAVKDFKTRTIEVPEWGGEVMLRTISGNDREKFETMVLEKTGKDGQVKDSKLIRATLLAMTICNEEGKRILDKSTISALNDKSSKVIERLFLEASELNGLNEQAVVEAKKN